MGILNRTPDSFYDHGAYFEFSDFLRMAEQKVAEGADILDIGGVKAGPGEDVPLDEELERVIPAVEAVASRFDVAVSVDTWNSVVLSEAINAGAHIGNDISGLADADYAKAAASSGAAIVITHIRLKPRVKDPNPQYKDLVDDVCNFLRDRVSKAIQYGVRTDSIVLDAGFDLGKTTVQSLELLAETDALRDLEFPVLISASNKGFLGEALDLPIDSRREASLAAAGIGFFLGASIFRVHDVAGTRKVLDAMYEITARRDSHALSDPS
jgi:dihydropteroate synthase